MPKTDAGSNQQIPHPVARPASRGFTNSRGGTPDRTGNYDELDVVGTSDEFDKTDVADAWLTEDTKYVIAVGMLNS
jgi:hypothetical protein